MDTDLENSHIFITGASGGIGKVTGEYFLKEGAKVSLHYNTVSETLDKITTQFPDNTYKIQANVLIETEVVAAIEKAVNKFGRINTIVINHGIWITEEVPLWEMELEQWEKTIGIDLTGAFLFAREYLRQLRGVNKNEKNVSIVFVGSTAGKFGEANHADYSTSKAGLMYGMTRSLKNEIINIHPRARVNSVMPGWVLTSMAKEALEDDAVLDKVFKTMALKKVATPEDIANSIVFLSSEKLSGHISGDILELAGGMEGRTLH